MNSADSGLASALFVFNVWLHPRVQRRSAVVTITTAERCGTLNGPKVKAALSTRHALGIVSEAVDWLRQRFGLNAI